MNRFLLKTSPHAVALFFFVSLTASLYSQQRAMEQAIADTAMSHASISYSVIDIYTGRYLYSYNGEKNMIPASLLKLVTAAAALDKLGAEHTFFTTSGYSGEIDKTSGTLTGDLYIRGGGDPALGASRFAGFYGDLNARFTDAVKKAGIKAIDGRIISDDSYYDYDPVPSKWLWEDIGNYFGAGVYGLSFKDNTYALHLKTSSKGTTPEITAIVPEEYDMDLCNMLTTAGNSDRGYIFSMPYSHRGWITGSVPENRNDFILKGAVTDPPLLLAKTLHKYLSDNNTTISGAPTTVRRMEQSANNKPNTAAISIIDTVISPPLKDIIRAMNHESINLYAEHILKELGRHLYDTGSAEAGIRAVYSFLEKAGIDTRNILIVDGSGLSSVNSISACNFTDMLRYMAVSCKDYPAFYRSLPAAGKEGTVKNRFKQSVFHSVKVKSGSMRGVRGYAGYMTSKTNRPLGFCIMINHYYGSSTTLSKHIEAILRETIVNN